MAKQNVTNRTDVHFAELSDAQLWSYIKSGEPFGKAGGYGIQGLGACLISRIEGDFYSVWGFPVHDFCKLITEMI